jgi:hypothetical protein
MLTKNELTPFYATQPLEAGTNVVTFSVVGWENCGEDKLLSYEEPDTSGLIRRWEERVNPP